jgi:predicted nucleotidyltransferase
MISEETIQEAVARLRQAAPEATIILFGSRARGEQGEASDLDFMVVEPEVKARRAEMVRLSDVLDPLGIPVDILVVSRKNFDEWRDVPGTVIFRVAKEGRVLYAPSEAV